MVHSCLIFGWRLALHFPFHWLMVRSVTVLDLFSCYLNINWRQHPTTQMSNILKTNHQIGWHHPKPNSILSFATSPLKRAQFHTPTEIVRGFRPYEAHPLGLSVTSRLENKEKWCKGLYLLRRGSLAGSCKSASDRIQEEWGLESTEPGLSWGLEANSNLCLHLTQPEPCKRVNLCPLAFLTVP